MPDPRGDLRGIDRFHRRGRAVRADDEISRSELFGPITILYRVRDFEEAVTLANDSPFGLTASIHTQNVHRAMTFIGRIQAGVAVVNGGTYGSEPHMPFGGFKYGSMGREGVRFAMEDMSEIRNLVIRREGIG